ncbi:hypothetical protein TanjilG_00130 [Lupinus angustifolius]|uniref:Acid phosphatase n=1 Tax=Lupinus angustifolius TaxID=3871 RepID=A0A1J7GK11_LUPAN|nr:PREDICTED: stem 28 kDa glycoprotein-like [Lupinus angustifolius]XP_019429299.1 PREDICTED: stem 28 kDa glycoprotein-like [Lupinus angustifolius]OIV90020.1 hypothetical protein TanjilG_00130 [Lupinus angustifolius]
MKIILLLFILATSIATSHGLDLDHGIDYNILPLRLKSGSGGHYIKGITCSSWRLGVEAHNIIDWKTIPQECEDYVGNYILGEQYRADSKAVISEAYLYAKSLNLTKDGKNIWVFDIDETSLSNLQYYANHGFGVEPFNATAFNEWVELGEAPALPESKKLYKKLLSLGIKIAFLTGRSESQRDITAKNLKDAGYYKYEKLVVKDTVKYKGKTAVTYKSAEREKLEQEGYRIIGNIGDQWSDILGTNTGNRTFKLPDPLYYIA